MKNIFTYLFIVVIITSLYGQGNNTDYLDLLIFKFKNEYQKEPNYLNVYIVEFKDTLAGIKYLAREDGSKLVLKKSRDTVKTYQIYYLKNPIGLDPITPFMISMFATYQAPKTGTGKSLIDKGSKTEKVKVDTFLVYLPNDFLFIKNSNNKTDRQNYNYILQYIREQINPSKLLKKEKVVKKEKYLLSIPIDQTNNNRMFKGSVSPDNTDQLKNLITNGYHKLTSYDKIRPLNTSNPEEVDTATTVNTGENWWNFFDIVYSDISLTKQTICINGISNLFSLGIAKVGFENSFEDRVLNYLPMEAPYHHYGVNVFFNMTGNLDEVQNNFFGNVRLLVRHRYNSANNFYWLPLFEVKHPKLNVNSGFTIEGELSKGFLSDVMKNLPVFTFYYSIGASKMPKPLYQLYDTSSIFPRYYYSRIQWEYGMSFFWNTSETSHYRLDLGVGGYDIYKNEYYLDTTDIPVIYSSTNRKNYVQPYIALTYDAIPNKAILGYKIKFYDSRISFKVWTRLFELFSSDVRLEANIITKPFYRSLYQWESPGGSLVQLRYRYAF